MKQKKEQQYFVQLRIAFQYTKKQRLSTKSLVLVVMKITLENEHASREDQPMYQHLSKCEHFAHIIDLHRLPDIDASTAEINNKRHFVDAIISNFCVLDTCCNWSQLLFSEALYIKNLAPKINDGVKAPCELVLF